MPIKRLFENLDEMLNSRELEYFLSDKSGNNLFISDPERAARIYDAAENGIDGSTHFEHISDWQDFLNSLKVYDSQYNYFDLTDLNQSYDITETTRKRIQDEIDNCEKYFLNQDKKS